MNTTSGVGIASIRVDSPTAQLQFIDPSSDLGSQPGKSWTASRLEPLVVDEATEQPYPLAEAARPEDEDVERDPLGRLRNLLGRLTGMGYLGFNWDSYGSEPPTAEARIKAGNLIWDIARTAFGTAEANAIPFAVVPLSGGGIQIEWRKAKSSIEIEVDPRGANFGYLLSKERQGNREFEERDNVSETDVVRQVIAALS